MKSNGKSLASPQTLAYNYNNTPYHHPSIAIAHTKNALSILPHPLRNPGSPPYTSPLVPVSALARPTPTPSKSHRMATPQLPTL